MSARLPHIGMGHLPCRRLERKWMAWVCRPAHALVVLLAAVGVISAPLAAAGEAPLAPNTVLKGTLVFEGVNENLVNRCDIELELENYKVDEWVNCHVNITATNPTSKIRGEFAPSGEIKILEINTSFDGTGTNTRGGAAFKLEGNVALSEGDETGTPVVAWHAVLRLSSPDYKADKAAAFKAKSAAAKEVGKPRITAQLLEPNATLKGQLTFQGVNRNLTNRCDIQISLKNYQVEEWVNCHVNLTATNPTSKLIGEYLPSGEIKWLQINTSFDGRGTNTRGGAAFDLSGNVTLAEGDETGTSVIAWRAILAFSNPEYSRRLAAYKKGETKTAATSQRLPAAQPAVTQQPQASRAEPTARQDATVIRSAPELTQAQIRMAQEALRALSLYQGGVDGIAGFDTHVAVAKWQSKKSYAATGKLLPPQLEELRQDAINASMTAANTSQRPKSKVATKTAMTAPKTAARPKPKQSQNKHAVAVIIGNRNYKNNVPAVSFAHNDADAMRRYLIENLGYRDGNIIDIRDATQARMMAVFGTSDTYRGELFSYVRRGKSDVTVYYSGHGVPSLKTRKGYLLPVDANPNLVEINGYPIDLLYRNLGKIESRSTTVYLDTCFSGDSPKGMLVRAASGLSVTPKMPRTAKKLIVFTAAQGDQFASWDEDAKLGLFTKHLLEALTGAADGAEYGDGNGKITVGEVQNYLDEEMTYQARRRYHRDQRASVQGDKNAVLSTLR